MVGYRVQQQTAVRLTAVIRHHSPVLSRSNHRRLGKVNEIFRARQDTQSSHSDAEGVQGWVIRNASSSSLGAHRAKAVRHAKEEKVTIEPGTVTPRPVCA